jgi:hypothetical protein
VFGEAARSTSGEVNGFNIKKKEKYYTCFVLAIARRPVFVVVVVSLADINRAVSSSCRDGLIQGELAQ